MAVYVVIPPCMAERHKDDGQTSVENPSSLKFPLKRRPGSPYARVLRGRWKRATAEQQMIEFKVLISNSERMIQVLGSNRTPKIHCTLW